MSTPTPDWKRPSPRLRRARHLQALVPAAVLAIALGVILAFSSTTAALIAAAAALLAGAIFDVLLQRRIGAWGYLEREDDLLVRRGLLVRRLSVVPYGRMQFIDVVAGPVERFFKLATVRLHTAAAATDARIPGLDAAEAARLRDRLAELGEADAAGL
jgi:membrane protein YdbS with pleckstrin-like domain